LEYTFFDWVQLVLTNYSGMILKGTGYTILLAIVGTGVGFLIGLLIGVYKTLPIREDDSLLKKVLYKVFNFLLSAYIEVFRSTPMIVQATVIFYGFAYATHTRLDVTTAAMIIISINTGAYMAEIVRGGIISVEKGQFEATHSIGMTHFQSMLYVILPQAIRNILPATGNQFIINIKDSCVLSVISVTELFFQTKSAAGATFQTFPAYFIACVIYFVLCFSITQILRKLETRMDGSETYTIYGTEPVINGADTLKRGDTR
jgi:putative lysine transport system permease protein